MERGRPLIIGHAGAAGEAPANTLAAVRACLTAAADAMEIDVQLTSDDIPVLLHDNTLDRTTNLEGPLRGFSAAEVGAADAGDGEAVPTLSDVLSTVQGRLTVMCELKATPGDESLDALLVDRVAGAIRRGEAVEWAAIHSFDAKIVERARSIAPDISVARISPPREGDALTSLLNGTVRRGAQAISIHHSCVTPELIRAAKLRQLTVWTWTADAPEDWGRVTAAGVDGIITNLPTALQAFLRSTA